MARRHLIAGIAFTGLGWGLFLAPLPGLLAEPARRPPRDFRCRQDNSADAAWKRSRPSEHRKTCHSERLKTAGLVLDPAALRVPAISLRPGRSCFVSCAPERCRLRARLDRAALLRARAGDLAREIEAAPRTPRSRPTAAGSPPDADRYANVIRDLLALPDLPEEFDTPRCCRPTTAAAASTIWLTRCLSRRRPWSSIGGGIKMSRVAWAIPAAALVNTHITPVRQPKSAATSHCPSARAADSDRRLFPAGR